MTDASRELCVVCESESSTEAFGRVVARVVAPGDVVMLIGELGAGKTTFVRGVVDGLGGGVAVTSPTFVLCHLYPTTPPVAHVDCWRFGDRTEIIDLALDEMLDDGAVAFIEWGDPDLPGLGDEHAVIELRLRSLDGTDEARIVTVHATPSWEDRLRVLRDEVGRDSDIVVCEVAS